MPSTYSVYAQKLKKQGLLLSNEIATISGIPLTDVQLIARLINVPKDSSNLYIFTEQEVIRFLKFLALKDDSPSPE